MDKHEFVFVCHRNGINQKFTRPAHSQTNDKAERAICTVIDNVA